MARESLLKDLLQLETLLERLEQWEIQKSAVSRLSRPMDAKEAALSTLRHQLRTVIQHIQQTQAGLSSDPLPQLQL